MLPGMADVPTDGKDVSRPVVLEESFSTWDLYYKSTLIRKLCTTRVTDRYDGRPGDARNGTTSGKAVCSGEPFSISTVACCCRRFRRINKTATEIANARAKTPPTVPAAMTDALLDREVL